MKHLKYNIIKIIKIFAIIFLFSFLLFNLISSQLISPLYFQMVKEDKNAVINFLQKIKNKAYFTSFLAESKNIYGTQIEQEVFSEDNKRKETIAELMSLLQKNPKSRDILYNLYLLYSQDGDKTKAEKYLRKAKEIDPMVK